MCNVWYHGLPIYYQSFVHLEIYYRYLYVIKNHSTVKYCDNEKTYLESFTDLNCLMSLWLKYVYYNILLCLFIYQFTTIFRKRDWWFFIYAAILHLIIFFGLPDPECSCFEGPYIFITPPIEYTQWWHSFSKVSHFPHTYNKVVHHL